MRLAWPGFEENSLVPSSPPRRRRVLERRMDKFGREYMRKVDHERNRKLSVPRFCGFPDLQKNGVHTSALVRESVYHTQRKQTGRRRHEVGEEPLPTTFINVSEENLDDATQGIRSKESCGYRIVASEQIDCNNVRRGIGRRIPHRSFAR